MGAFVFCFGRDYTMFIPSKNAIPETTVLYRRNVSKA